MKRVMVTGASGFIGGNCLADLVKLGYDVHTVTSDPIEEIDLRIKWHRADLLDIKQIERLMKDVRATHLLHFAWHTEPKRYWNSEENFKWVEAGKVLLRAFYSNGGRRAVMAGTCAEYSWRHGRCFENSTPLLPSTLYGQCKHSLQIALANFSDETGLSSAWGRIFFLYGPNERPERLVPSVITSILRGRPALCSHGNQVRDFLYVKDVASAFIALLGSAVRGPVNIASGRPLALREIICKIGEKLGHPELIRLGELPASKDEPQLLVADVAKLNLEIGWTPGYDIDSGLDQTIEWWRGYMERV